VWFQVFFDIDALALIRTLIVGGVKLELEQILSEGDGMRGGYVTPATIAVQNRCRVAQIAIKDGPFNNFEVKLY